MSIRVYKGSPTGCNPDSKDEVANITVENLHMALTVLSVVEDAVLRCIEQDIEVGKADLYTHEAFEYMLKACAEMGMNLEQVNEQPFEIYPPHPLFSEDEEE